MDAFIKDIVSTYQEKNKSIPQLLYHYTSIDGLCGIMDSKKIWASNISYLNDKSEFQYSVSQFAKYIKEKFKAESKNELLKLSIESMVRREALKRYNVFVTSFSAKSDLLSQWRGYCPRNYGFSLGFKFDSNNFMIERSDVSIYLLPCVYDENDRGDLFDKLIGTHFDGIEEVFIKTTDTGNFQKKREQWEKEYIEKYLVVSSILKNISFSEEDEWRLVVISNRKSNKLEVVFRKGFSFLIPYIVIPLGSAHIDLREVIIGPTQYPDLSKESIIQKSKKMNLKIKINNSKIPYRSFIKE